MNGCVLLYSRLQCSDTAAIIGTAHNELSRINRKVHLHITTYKLAHRVVHTAEETVFKRPLRKRAAGPCWLPEVVTESWKNSAGMISII